MCKYFTRKCYKMPFVERIFGENIRQITSQQFSLLDFYSKSCVMSNVLHQTLFAKMTKTSPYSQEMKDNSISYKLWLWWSSHFSTVNG